MIKQHRWAMPPAISRLAALVLGAPLVMEGSRLLGSGDSENWSTIALGVLLFLGGQAIVRFEDFQWEKGKGLRHDEETVVPQTPQPLISPLAPGGSKGG